MWHAESEQIGAAETSERSERTEDTAGQLAGGRRSDPVTEAFVAAYEIPGSAADVEDVLQETWLRWAGVDLGTVRDQRAYLVRITTRQALSRLRAPAAVGSPTSALGCPSRCYRA